MDDDAAVVPTPLPNNPDWKQAVFPELTDAFNTCKQLEAADNWGTKAASGHTMLRMSPQVAARTLGYALMYAPSEDARDCVVREINACDHEPEILAGLAHLYIHGMIRVFRNPEGPTPPISEELSPGVPVEEHDRTTTPVGRTPHWLKDMLLLRDNHRCALTKRLDIPSVISGVVPYNPAELKASGVDTLKVAHIISQSLTGGVGEMTPAAQNKFPWASSAAAVIDRFAAIEIRTLLGGLNLHHPTNAMILSSNVHHLFDQLMISLTPSQDAENTYDVHVDHPVLRYMGLPRQVQFQGCTTPEGDDVPPPSRTLLEIHAACARIARLSGAAELLDEFYGNGDTDGDALPGLSHDHGDMSGVSALDRALRRVQVAGP